MSVSRAISVGFGALLVFGSLGCNPVNEDIGGGEYVRGASGKADGVETSFFYKARILTSEAELLARLDEGVNLKGLTVEDQYLYSIGVTSKAVEALCGPDPAQCHINTDGFKRFKDWLYSRVVVGPRVPRDANGAYASASGALQECRQEHGTQCGALSYEGLMKAQVREIASSPVDLHEAQLAVVKREFLAMEMFYSGGSFGVVLPTALRSARAERFNILAKQSPGLLTKIECYPPVQGQMCSIIPVVESLQANYLGMFDFSVTAKAFIRIKRAEIGGKFIAWDPPIAEHIGLVQFLSKQVKSCSPTVGHGEYTEAHPDGESFAFHYMDSPSPIWSGTIKLKPRKDKKGWSVLGFQVTYVPENSLLHLFDADVVVFGGASSNLKLGQSDRFCTDVFVKTP